MSRETIKIILPLVYFFSIVFVVEAILYHLVCNYLLINDDKLVAVRGINEINQSAGADKIIIFGSSMSREGIDVPYLKNGLFGKEIYNLSVSSGKPSDFYLIFDRIKDKKKIKLVMIDISQWMFRRKYSDDVRNGEDMSTNFFFSPVAAVRMLGFDNFNIAWFLKRSGMSSVPSVKYNSYLKKIIDHYNISFWKQPAERDDPEVYFTYQYSKNKPDEYFTEQLADADNRADFSDENYLWAEKDNIQIKALIELLRELDKNNIKAMVIDSPVNPRIKELYSGNVQEKYLSCVRNSLLRGQNFYEMAFSYGTEQFIDFYHLNYKGRSAFSGDLIQIIANDYVF